MMWSCCSVGGFGMVSFFRLVKLLQVSQPGELLQVSQHSIPQVQLDHSWGQSGQLLSGVCACDFAPYLNAGQVFEGVQPQVSAS